MSDVAHECVKSISLTHVTHRKELCCTYEACFQHVTKKLEREKRSDSEKESERVRERARKRERVLESVRNELKKGKKVREDERVERACV